jgi:lysophospholipase L1-like esterase
MSGTEGPAAARVLLLGDSIRLGYAPRVTACLAGAAEVVSPAANGGDSANLRRHLDEWLAGAGSGPGVDVVHFNCGLHDLKRDEATGEYQVPLAQYEANLRALVDRLRATGAALVFATSTPIEDGRHARRGVGFDRSDADVRRYNAVAAEVMGAAGVAVHDLYWVVEEGGGAELLGPDGTHFTPAGYARLAEAVADCVRRQLIVRRYQPLPVPAGGPEGAAAYRAREAERDALVPAAYKGRLGGAFRVPEDGVAWAAQRPGVYQTVARSLGDLPPRPGRGLRARRVTRERRSGYTLEKVALDNGVGGEISALLLIPGGVERPAPAVLWLHSSTPDKTQIVVPDTNGGREPLGEALVRAGYVVMAPDAYWHGDRAGTGPAGRRETRREEQESLFKLHLWLGRTLWGMFVRDDQIALDYLCARPEVDGARIGATGMSMGSTRAWWLAAVDERIAAAVGVACLTRYENLIAHGELRAHGLYYFVDGLLRHFDTEGVLALIAPRPFLALTGDLDAGSPADGIRVLEERVGRVYAALGAPERFKSVLYADVGHTYTPAMREEALAWLDRWLWPAAGR